MNSFYYSKNNYNINHYGKSNGDATVIKAIFWSDSGGEFVFADGSLMSFTNCMETFAIASGTSARQQRPVDLVVTSMCLSHYKEKCKAAISVYNCFSPRPRLINGLVPNSLEELFWRGKTPIESLVISTDPSLFSITRVMTASSCSVMPIITVPSMTCALKHVVMTLHPCRRVFSVRWPCPVVGSDGAHHIFTTPVDDNGNIKSLLPTEKVIRYVMLEQMFPVLNPPVQWREMLDVLIYHDNTFKETPSVYPHLCSLGVTSVSDCHGTENWDNKDKTQGEDNSHGCIGSISQYRTWVSTLPQVMVFHTSAAHSTIRFPSLHQEDANAFYAATELQNVTCNRLRLHTPLTRMNQRTSGKVGIMIEKGYKEAADGPTVMWRYDSDDQERSPPAVYWCIGRDQWAVMNPAEGSYSAHHSRGEIMGNITTVGRKLPYEYEDDTKKMEAEQMRRDEGFDPALDGTVECYIFEDLSVVSACPIRKGPVGLDVGCSSVTPNSFVITHTLAGCFPHPPTDAEEGNGEKEPDNEKRTIIQNKVQTYHFDPEDGNVKLPCHVISTGVFLSKRTNDLGPDTDSAPINTGGSTLPIVRGALFLPGSSSFYQKSNNTKQQCSAIIPNSSVVISPDGKDAVGQHLAYSTQAIDSGDSSLPITGLGSYPLRLGRYMPSVGASAASLSLLNQRQQVSLLTSRISAHNRDNINAMDDNSIIRCSTIVNGVGVFTALCNGVVRGVFDDRCIVTLTPSDDGDSEAGLTAHMVAPDATVRVCRVVQCLPNNPLHGYLQYMMPFRRYSRISKEERDALAAELSVWKDDVPPSYAQLPSIGTTTGSCNSVIHRRNAEDSNHHLPGMNYSSIQSPIRGVSTEGGRYQSPGTNEVSSNEWSIGSVHRYTSSMRGDINDRPIVTAGTYHNSSSGGMSEIDMLIFRTKQTLNSAIEVNKESNMLLRRAK